MQTIVKAVNPTLRGLNYLLLTTLLFLLAVLLAVYLLQWMGYEIVVSGDMKQAAVPFALAASTSMFFFQRLRQKKD